MFQAELDHIVVAAGNLQRGADYLEELLGVPVQPGGCHQTQATHNRLLRLGDNQYLEIISIDPDGNEPGHPRWFDLDNPELQSRIMDAPRLVTWAVRVPDMARMVQISPYDGCEVQNLSRGDLRWRAALTPGGRLLEEGALPLAIQWQVESIPPRLLPDSGCVIDKVTVQHPQPQRIDKKFMEMGLVSPVLVVHGEQIRLVVDLKTPKGPVRLCSS